MSAQLPTGLLRRFNRVNGAPRLATQPQLHRHFSFRTNLHHRPRRALSQQVGSQTRFQSTAAAVATATQSTGSSFLAYAYGTGVLVLLGFGYLYITDTRASVHQWLVVPALRLIHYDPEEAHHAGLRYIQTLYDFGLHPRERGDLDNRTGDLKIEVFGHVLDNPIGTSAGIDKNAEIPSPLFALGPAIVEVGGITPLPQTGNDKPRVFRIPSQNALINRYGLNSEGADHVTLELRDRVRQFAYRNGLGLGPAAEQAVLNGELGVPPGSLIPGKLLAVQMAKNKTTPDQDIAAVARDYVYCVDRLARYADILVVNVSSPNTPGLRDLQAAAPLTAILTAVVDAAKSADRKTKPAVMVKVSPDEDSDAQIEGIRSAVWSSGVDGVIVGNTTKKRPDPVPKGFIMPANETKLLSEVGGYSGPQMFDRTLNLVKRYRSKLDEGPADDSPTLSSPAEDSKSHASQPSSDPYAASTQRDIEHLKSLTQEADKASKQPLIQLPNQSSSTSGGSDNTISAASQQTSQSEVSAHQDQPLQAKVIFATGGITNGDQCLQILNAGASVCQVYTAMMYGGVGTITRMKSELRDAVKKHSE